MARSRRKYRRTATQSAASLLALALPAPIQRAADTRLGPLLMFFGLPAMLVFGLLQVNWQNGTPQLSINSQKAAELRDAAKSKIQNFDTQGHLQQFEHSARDVWNTAQSQFSQAGYNSNPVATNQYPSNQIPSNQYGAQQSQSYGSDSYGSQTLQPASVNNQVPFPSTKPKLTNTPLDYTRTGTTNSSQVSTANASTAYGYGNTAQQTNQPTDALTYQQQLQQQQYEQQLYQQQLYERQLYEQQLYQQQVYQQQLYEQARQQQQQTQNQWQPQSNQTYNSQTYAPQQNYAPQYDQYGRPYTSSGYVNPTPSYTQGAFPSNSSGRY